MVIMSEPLNEVIYNTKSEESIYVTRYPEKGFTGLLVLDDGNLTWLIRHDHFRTNYSKKTNWIIVAKRE